MKARLTKLRHPTFKQATLGGAAILLIAVISATVISLFDSGITSIINLFI